MWKLEVRTRLVGLEETSNAEARLALWNCAKRKAVGGTIRACDVKYATNGVPLSTMGSLPTANARITNKP